jgi:hypothetical protein
VNINDLQHHDVKATASGEEIENNNLHLRLCTKTRALNRGGRVLHAITMPRLRSLVCASCGEAQRSHVFRIEDCLRDVFQCKLAERQSCDMVLSSSRANIQRAVVYSRTVHGCYPHISPPQLVQSPRGRLETHRGPLARPFVASRHCN